MWSEYPITGEADGLSSSDGRVFTLVTGGSTVSSERRRYPRSIVAESMGIDKLRHYQRG